MSDILQSGTLPTAGPHPDADQLCAFAENLLPDHLREQTLLHLAVCPDCRSVVSFLQPVETLDSAAPALAAHSVPIAPPVPITQSVSAVQPVPASPEPRPQPAKRWFSSWTFAMPVAAALAAITFAALYLYTPSPDRRQATTPTEARNVVPRPAPANPQPIPQLNSPSPVRSATKLAGPQKPAVPSAVETTQDAKTPPVSGNVTAPALPPASARNQSLAGVPAHHPNFSVSPMLGQLSQKAPLAASGAIAGSAPPSPSLAPSRVPSPAPTQAAANTPGQAFARARSTESANPTASLAKSAPPLRIANAVTPPATASAGAAPPASASSAASAATPASPPPLTPQPQPPATSPAQAVNVTAAVTAEAASISLDSATVESAQIPETPRRPLPSRLPVLSMIERGRQVVAIDTAHALFLSKDGGNHWKSVQVPWISQAIRVELAAPLTPTQQVTQIASGSANRVSGKLTPRDKIARNEIEEDLSTGSLAGQVTDAAGAVIPGATVSVTNKTLLTPGGQTSGTATTTIATTGKTGRFLISGLSPGTYSVQAEAVGFEKNVQSPVAVPSSATASVNFVLQVGASAQTVTVEAAAAPLAETTPSKKTPASPTPVPPAPTDLFSVTTDTGEHWISTDGLAWHRR